MTVALVLVAHVAEIAEGVRRLAAQMAPEVPILTAGGTDDGGVGTSFDKVTAALGEALGPDGAVVLYDLGSALLTAETAAEMLDDPRVEIVDAPLVEGTLAAATAAQQGGDRTGVARAAREQAGPASAEAGQRLAATEPGPGAVTAEVTLRNPLGLHARPAADLARMLTAVEARLLLTGKGGEWVDARSVVAVLGLGLRGGDQVRMAAEGPGAADALDRVRGLVESGFGETDEAPAPTTTLTGVAASPGVSEGPAVLVIPTPRADEHPRSIDVETQRLATAIDSAATQLASVEEAFRPIAEAHRVLLDDPMLRGRAADLVDRGRAAGPAWDAAVEEAHALLAGVADTAMADRAADVLDVGARVSAALRGRDFDAGLPDRHALAGAVVVAGDVLPSQVVRAHAAGAGAVVGARGGESAHAAQLARVLGLPAVLGAGDGVRTVGAGRRVRVDGDTGQVEVR